MSQKDDHLIGITPITMRRAAFYLSLGFGEYTPYHPHYDKVVVAPLYEVTQNPSDSSEWALGIQVSFHQNGRKIRWVDFTCAVSGVGGDPIFRKVDVSDE